MNHHTQTPRYLNLPPCLDGLVKSALGLKEIEKKYRELVGTSGSSSSPGDFCRAALSAVDVSFEIPIDAEIHKLRQIKGPLIFVSNHPFGAIDALVLMTLMSDVRPQFKLIANAFLASIPELAPVILPVHISDAAPHSPKNIGAMRSTLQFLLDGGLLGIFPAGEASSLPSWRSRVARDREWSHHLGRLVRKSKATVIPLHFEGQNRLLSHYLGLALPQLRIALIAWETLHHSTPLRFQVGRPIRFTELEWLQADRELTEYLRNQVESLKVSQPGK